MPSKTPFWRLAREKIANLHNDFWKSNEKWFEVPVANLNVNAGGPIIRHSTFDDPNIERI